MKTLESFYGMVDRFMYELGGTPICIDKMHEPFIESRPWIWIIRESRTHCSKRANESGEITFPHVHISKIKVDGSYETHGIALIEAIKYLNTKRKEGIL